MLTTFACSAVVPRPPAEAAWSTTSDAPTAATTPAASATLRFLIPHLRSVVVRTQLCGPARRSASGREDVRTQERRDDRIRNVDHLRDAEVDGDAREHVRL